jgi:hypothetical protein
MIDPVLTFKDNLFLYCNYNFFYSTNELNFFFNNNTSYYQFVNALTEVVYFKNNPKRVGSFFSLYQAQKNLEELNL